MPDTETDENAPDPRRTPSTEKARRVVVKLGTNTLQDPDGEPDPHLLSTIAEEIKALNVAGKQVLVVSSGAIGCGLSAMKLGDRPQDVPMRQGLAAIGQHRLMAAWDQALGKQRVRTAQILVTRDTFNDRHAYLNLRHCLETLLKLGVVPIINENDTVSTDEIDVGFGDNDNLGALVAAKVEADLYCILSDVGGLYDKPPHMEGATLLDHVERIDEAILEAAGDRPGKGGSGGMRSKLEATRLLTEAGVPVVIAYGREPAVLDRILHGENVGTWFDAVGHQTGKERWIMAARSQGRIIVDAGAAKALQEGYHLLPAGVTDVEGDFPVESVVDIVHDGTPIARAVATFSSRDLAATKGRQSDEVRTVLDVEGSVNVTRKGRLRLLDD